MSVVNHNRTLGNTHGIARYSVYITKIVGIYTTTNVNLNDVLPSYLPGGKFKQTSARGQSAQADWPYQGTVRRFVYQGIVISRIGITKSPS